MKSFVSETTSHRRSQAKKSTYIKQHFDQLNIVVDQIKRDYNIETLHDYQYGNMDEKPFGCRNKKDSKVIVGKEQETHYSMSNNFSYTVVETIFGNGHVGKRLYIFCGKKLPDDFCMADIKWHCMYK